MSLFGASTASNPAQNSGSSAISRSMSFPTTSNNTGSLFGVQNNNTNPQTHSGTQTGGMFSTTASNTGSGSSLFGQSSVPPNNAGSNLFGQNNTSTNTGGGLFGQNNNSNTGGGLFGQNNNSNTGGGLFGQNNNSNTGGGLFGQNNNSNAGGGLFGQNNTTSSNTGGGLFGQNNTTSSNTGGNLFGQSNSTNNASGSLFGQKSSMGSGMFGQSISNSTTGQQNSAGQGLFGSQPASALGSSLTAPSQSTSPLMQHAYYQRERYNELPEAQRSLLDSMEKFISSQAQIKHEMRARNANESMRRLMTNVHELMSEQQALTAALETDSIRLQSIVVKVEQDRNDDVMLHQMAMNAKDKLSDGTSFVDWVRRFYERMSEEYVSRIQRYRLTMEQLERHLESIDQGEQFAPQVISDIMHEQSTLFMSLAEQVATLHTEIDLLKKDYVKWYQARFHSVRDPFAPVTAAAGDRP